MARIVAIVEGHGEMDAVPILLGRIAEAVAPATDVAILPPIRVDRYGVVKQGELERAVELAARMTGTDGSILLLLDAGRRLPGRTWSRAVGASQGCATGSHDSRRAGKGRVRSVVPCGDGIDCRALRH